MRSNAGYIYVSDRKCHICNNHTLNFCGNCKKGVCTSHSKKLDIAYEYWTICCDKCWNKVMQTRKCGKINIDAKVSFY